MIGRSIGCTLMLVSAIMLPVGLMGCEGKPATTTSGKEAGTQSAKDKGGVKPTPPERDPG